MLTCYDYPTARALTRGGIDLLLVGDSVGPNILGLASVRDVTVEMVCHHVGATRRGAGDAWIVADLPFGAFSDASVAIQNGRRLLDAGANLVKMEGGLEEVPLLEAMVREGIPMVAHIGHKPQQYETGSRVVGADASSALQTLREAKAFEKAGAAIVLMECVPARVAEAITTRLHLPTIGIGAGPGCDGQVLVVADLLGWFQNTFRFALHLDDFAARTAEVAAEFHRRVQGGEFPTAEQSFGIRMEEYEAFLRQAGDEEVGAS